MKTEGVTSITLTPSYRAHTGYNIMPIILFLRFFLDIVDINPILVAAEIALKQT